MKKYNRKDIDNVELCHEYWDLNISTSELGRKYHCSPETIANRLRDMGVGIKGRSESHKGEWSAERLSKRREKYYPAIKKLYEMDEAWLRNKYEEDKWTPAQFANYIGCSASYVRKRLVEIGVQLRNISESKEGNKLSEQALLSVKEKRLLHPKIPKFNISKEEIEYKYLIEMKGTTDIAKEYGCSAPTVAKRMSELGIKRRSGSDAHKTKSYAGKMKGHWIEKQGEDYHKLPEGKPKVGQLIDGKLLGRLHTHMWHKCPMCGKERWVAIGNLKNSKTNGLCAMCVYKDEKVRQKHADVNNKRYENPEEREKTAESSRKMWAADPIRKEEHAEFLRKMVKTPYVRQKQSEAIRKFWDDPEHGEERKVKTGKRFSKQVKALWDDPVYKEEKVRKHGALQKRLWSNPEYRDKQSKIMRIGCEARPTKPEIVVIDILNKLYPSEWKYVGDGEIIIEGKNPDIINVNGKKAIIEVFGTYWHSMEVRKECPLIHELSRIDLYTKYGYKTLVLWQHELKDEGSAVKKIKEFCAIIGLHNEV